MPSATLDQSRTSNIPPSVMPLISPQAFLDAHLSQPLPTRPSGRSISECRPIDVNVGSLTHCNGSSVVKIGASTVVCGIRAEILPVSEIPSYRVTNSSISYDNQTEMVDLDDEEYSIIPLQHLLVPNLELSTGCSPSNLANTPPSSEAQSITQRLLSLLHTSKLVRTSDLAVVYTPPPDTELEEGSEDSGPQVKAYWVLYIDMMCISYGGSLFDAAWMALYSALKDTLLPRSQWDIDEQRVVCSPDVTQATRLGLRGRPVPCTFGVFQAGKQTSGESRQWILLDTDTFEEDSCDERGCVTIDKDAAGHFEVVRIEKSGGGAAGPLEVREVLLASEKRWLEWKNVLDRILRVSA